MDMILVVIALAFVAWTLMEVLDALVSESHLEAVHVTREAVVTAAAVGGVLVFGLATGERLQWGWALAAVASGLIVGYWSSWRGGHDAIAGVALVRDSRVSVVAFGLAGVVAVLGSLGLGDTVYAFGLLAFHWSVGLIAGRFGYRLEAARRAGRAFAGEVHVALVRQCGGCGAPLAPDARFCTTCGAEQTHACSSCGAELPRGSTACDSCGARVDVDTVPDEAATWQRACVVCATPLSAGNDFCPTCGVRAPAPCDFCGGPAMAGDVDCVVCGIDLEVAEVATEDAEALRGAPTHTTAPCPHCGASNAAGTRFCTACGHELHPHH